MSETHEHLEHAEHAAHGTDPFTMRVAMTMTIIAAVLAAVTLIGHRKHNEALQKQGDSNRLKTEAAAEEVKQSNIFAWYQAKRARVEQAANSIAMSKLLAPIAVPVGGDVENAKVESEGDSPRGLYRKAFVEREAAQAAEIKKWEAYIKKNDTKIDSIKLDAAGYPVKNDKGEDDDTLGALIIRGNKFKECAKEKAKEADAVLEEYEHVHHQADGLDWAHLTLELGLVLCTIAVLTKKSEYWAAGILAGIIGVGLAAYALFVIH